MREKLSKLVVLFAFFSTVTIGNLSPLTASAAPDTCTWAGATNGNWSVGSNWSGCDNGGIPEDGDTLVFPETALNKTMTNDLSSLDLFSLNSLTIDGTGYTFGGNGFTLTGITAITANEPATINVDITYNSGSHVNIYPPSGGTLTLNGITIFTLSSFYEVNVGSSLHDGVVDFTGNISGNAASQFIVQHGASAIVRGSTNTYTAAQVGAESDGIFDCRSATCFGDNTNDIYVGNGRVAINVSDTFSNDFITSSSSAGNSEIEATQNVSITGAGTVNDELVTYQSAASSNLQFTGAITLNQNLTSATNHMNSTVRFDSAISGAGDITAYQGRTVLSGANTFTGDVTVKNNAVLTATGANGLGATSAPTIVEDGGSLNFDTASQFTVNEPLTLTGDGNVNSEGAVRLDSMDSVNLDGAITLNGDTTIRNVSGDTTLSLRGVIGGSGDLTLVGQWHASSPAYIAVAGAVPNAFNGTTNVIGGTVYFEKTSAIPGDLNINNTGSNRSQVYFYDSSNVMSDTGVITMGADEHNGIVFGEDNEIIGGLQGTNGVVRVQNGNDKVIIDQDFNSTYAGTFFTDGSDATIEKRGTGNLILTGDYQFIGDRITFVATEGILTANGELRTTSGGNVEVNGGTLKGTGIVGAVSSNGGTIAPGTSPGKLTVGSLALDPTNTVEFELDGPIAGTSYDQIVSNGTVNLADAALSIKPSYTPSTGQVFTIITGSSVTGTFKNMPNNSTVIVDGITFRINYNATSVTLTYVDGAYDPSANDSLVNTGTGMLLAAIASMLLIAAAIALTGRRKPQPIA